MRLEAKRLRMDSMDMATWVDIAIFVLPWWVPIFSYLLYDELADGDGVTTMFLFVVMAFGFFSFIMVAMFAPVVFKNRSPGMRLFGVMIADMDGNPASVKQIMYRQAMHVPIMLEVIRITIFDDDDYLLGYKRSRTRLVLVEKSDKGKKK